MVNPRSHTGLPAVLRHHIRSLRHATQGRQRFRPSAWVWPLDAAGRPRVEGAPDLLADVPSVAAVPIADHGMCVDMLTTGLASCQDLLGKLPPPEPPEPPESPEPPVALAAPYAMAALQRPGPLEITDADLAWWRAWRAACAIAGAAVGRLVALTRHGWIDLETGQIVPVSRYHRRPAA